MGNKRKYGEIEDIPRANGENGEEFPPPPPVLIGGADVMRLLGTLPKTQREKLTAGYDIKTLAKIFEDGETMRTVDAFLENDLSVCRAARALYMHRNTLIYRLNAIRRQTGFDLRVFNMAVTFKILNY